MRPALEDRRGIPPQPAVSSARRQHTLVRPVLTSIAIALVLLAAYANHFENGFHFDDAHTVINNPFIRDLHNIPRFFRDPMLFSTMPDHATYRPLTSLSLAVDYWLGHGLKPFYFHLSTFFWLVVQVTLMFFLFHRLMDMAHPHPTNEWVALGAALCYGLHPVSAETVNYVIQRADLLATLGIVASVLWYVARPAQRRFGWYLIPALAAFFAKSLIVYPFLLIYDFLFEQEGTIAFRDPAGNRAKWAAAFRATLPALILTIIEAFLLWRMTPPTFAPGALSPSLYRITQPWIALHYFKALFLPTELTADTDLSYVSGPLSTEAVAGYVFVLGLLFTAFRTSRKRETRPIAFGILWFFLALLPTSLIPLAEVANDHRMYLAFVGLVLSAVWSLRLLFLRTGETPVISPLWRRAIVPAAILILAAEAFGTRARNEVWRTDESLWLDVIAKSPRNGRGLMNYGLVVMARGEYALALSYFERAAQFTPNYWALEVNQAIALGGLHRDSDAQAHFQRAISLAPGFADPYFYYGRWLDSAGRTDEAVGILQTAARINPAFVDPRHLLMQIYARRQDSQNLQRLASETLQLDPTDESAKRYSAGVSQPVPLAAAIPQANVTPENLLDLSHQYYQAGRFEDCITAAKKAIQLKPDYADAYNNLAAAYNSLGKWDEGIQAATQAILLKPDYQLAKNNLAWAMEQKQKSQAGR